MGFQFAPTGRPPIGEKAKVPISLRVDPDLKSWAKSRGINLSEMLGRSLTEMRQAERDAQPVSNNDVPF